MTQNLSFYNANTESEHIQTFNKLNMLLSNLDLSSEHIIFAGDFNLFLDCSLDAKDFLRLLLFLLYNAGWMISKIL